MNIVLFDNLTQNGINTISINSRQSQHIINILKLKEGDIFRSGIYSISSGISKIVKIDSKELYFTYTAENATCLHTPLIMLLGLIRPICVKRVLRFVGEAGLRALVIVPCELSEKSYSQGGVYQKSEAEKLIREGVEFSHSFIKPEYIFANNLSEAMDYLNSVGCKNRYLLDEKSDTQKLNNSYRELSCIGIGPERGWTENERDIFIKNGFLQYNIGKKILRSEEAAIVSVFPWL